ncbi:hypothetical protein [Dapis sp. BLCC M229]
MQGNAYQERERAPREWECLNYAAKHYRDENTAIIYESRVGSPRH